MILFVFRKYISIYSVQHQDLLQDEYGRLSVSVMLMRRARWIIYHVANPLLQYRGGGVRWGHLRCDVNA